MIEPLTLLPALGWMKKPWAAEDQLVEKVGHKNMPTKPDLNLKKLLVNIWSANIQ